MRSVTGGDTDITTYFALRLAADGTEATGLTPTDFDLQYVRSGVAPEAKVDATALAATDSAHASNKVIEIDATDQPGLYRVDWPDAAFAAGVPEVILTVKVATAFAEHLAVPIDPPVNLTKWLGTAAATPTVAGVPEVDWTHVMGTILTEGGAGRLAAAIVKLFDVASPLLMASDVMRGTDGANTTTPLDAAGVRGAVGLASANLDDQLDALPTAAENTTALEADGSKLDHVWETTEDNAGTRRFSVAGLLQGPGGGGADVTTDIASRTASKADVSALATTTALNTHDGKLDTAQTDLDTLTDAMSELTTDPGATPTPQQALMLWYMFLRNNSTATASLRTIKNDAGASVLTATMTDDLTTFSQGKLADA